MPKKITARIALAVDARGKFRACGSTSLSDSDAMYLALEDIGEGERRYFVSVEVELPDAVEPIEVAGTAERVDVTVES